MAEKLRQHVFPSGRNHVTEGGDCWCSPQFKAVCPECEDSRDPNPECWKCQGDGLIIVSDFERADIISHWGL